MQRGPISAIWLRDESTGPKKVHNIQPSKPLATQFLEKGNNSVSNESRMARCNLSALYVFDLQANSKGIDTPESIHCIVETVINHPYEWYFIVEKSTDPVELRLTSLRMTMRVQPSANMSVLIVIKNI